jgi:hypothetical protein
MLAGSGAPPPEENQLKENITSYSKPQSRGPAYWPLIFAEVLIDSSAAEFGIPSESPPTRKLLLEQQEAELLSEE